MKLYQVDIRAKMSDGGIPNVEPRNTYKVAASTVDEAIAQAWFIFASGYSRKMIPIEIRITFPDN